MMDIRLPIRVKERIKKGLAKYAKILADARDKNLGEADTSKIVVDVLSDVLGYNKFFDVTAEFRIRGKFADFVVRLNDMQRVIVEVKSIGTALRADHIRQAVEYGATEGIEWVVLTNGAEWQVYHIKFEKPLEWDFVYSVDFLDKSMATEEKIRLLYLISKESVKKNEIAEYWQKKVALSAKNVVSILLSDPLIERVRRELKNLTGYRISPDELRALMKSQVLRPSFGEIVISAISTKQARRKRKKPAKKVA